MSYIVEYNKQERIRELEQIFLPYIITGSGRTLYEGIAERHFQLGPGEGE